MGARPWAAVVAWRLQCVEYTSGVPDNAFPPDPHVLTTFFRSALESRVRQKCRDRAMVAVHQVHARSPVSSGSRSSPWDVEESASVAALAADFDSVFRLFAGECKPAARAVPL